MTALLTKALVIAVVSYGPCPGVPDAYGCAIRPNVIYLSTVDAAGQPLPSWLLRQNRNHELGHIADYNLLTNADRGTFEALMHMRRPWVDPPDSPHEQFAEAVRWCAHSTRWPRSGGGGFGYRPTVHQHRKICRWLSSIGARS